MRTTTRDSSMLVGRGLTKHIDGRTLWRGLDVDLEPRTITALTGVSGSGKTTLLNVLGLLDAPSSGELRLGKRRLSGISGKDTRRLYREHFAFLFQNYALVEQWTVRANLELALRSIGVGKRARASRIRDALESVGLGDHEKSRIYTLSGGEQQRVAIARVMVHRPSIVLADEPTAALDPDNAHTVKDHLRRFADDGAVVVLTTHDEHMARDADQTLRL